MDGYIVLQRKFFENKFWKEKRAFSKAEAWVDLIREARFEVEPVSTFINGKLVSWGRGELPVSLRFLAQRWGWSKNKVDNFIKFLVNDNAIKLRTQDGTLQTIATLCNYDTYNFVSEKQGHQRDIEGTSKGHQRDKTNKDNKDNKGNNNRNIDKDILSGICEIVIEYLNKKTGKSFGADSKATTKVISARVNEGKLVEDFFAVIDVKTSQWLDDPKMFHYLRPETLFSEKFDSYLVESKSKLVAINHGPSKSRFVA